MFWGAVESANSGLRLGRFLDVFCLLMYLLQNQKARNGGRIKRDQMQRS